VRPPLHLETHDFISCIITTKPEELVLLGHEYVNLTHRLLVNGSRWQGYHILHVSTQPAVDSFEIQDGLGGCTTIFCQSVSHVMYSFKKYSSEERDKMNLLEHVIRRDESFCISDWYLLLADTEAKSWSSLDTSMGSKTSTYFSQVFKIQSQQSLNRLTKNKIEVTGTQVLLSVKTMDCRESSMKRRHVASTFSYILGRYPSSESNSSTMNSLKREAPCKILQPHSYFVLNSM